MTVLIILYCSINYWLKKARPKMKKNHANLRSSGKRKLPNSFIFVVYNGVQIFSRVRVFKRQDSSLSAFLQIDLQLYFFRSVLAFDF